LQPGIFKRKRIKSDIGNGKTAIIEYSSPNIAKPMNIGHLRSTVIGAALKRIYEYLGYKVVSINHIGDWGTQFGKLALAYKKWADTKKMEEDPINELYRIYVRMKLVVCSKGWRMATLK